MRFFLFLAALVLSSAAWAGSPGIINQYNALCGANTPSYCAQPDSSGNLPVTGTITGSVSVGATATAAAPTYLEGISDPFSQTLTGNLRVTGVGGSFPVTGTFFQATQPVSGTVAATQSGTWTITGAGGTFPITAASGAIASGALASGSVSSGAIASGAVASGAVASGAFAVGSITNGADVALGLTTDAKSTATDTTAATLISIAKEISFMEQTPASRAVTNAGTFAVQSTPGVSTSGGVTPYILEPTASDNHAVVKNGAGNVYWITAFNNSATINYIRLYNAGTGFNGCNSATNLAYEGHIPASTSDAGFVVNLGTPLSFATGISICVTGAYGQTSTTNATASAMSITIGYN